MKTHFHEFEQFDLFLPVNNSDENSNNPSPLGGNVSIKEWKPLTWNHLFKASSQTQVQFKFDERNERTGDFYYWLFLFVLGFEGLFFSLSFLFEFGFRGVEEGRTFGGA